MLAEKYRWEAVDCYIQNALVCHSDDEKCIGWAVKESKALKADSRRISKLWAQLINHLLRIRIHPAPGKLLFPQESRNWISTKAKGAFVAEELGILPKTAALLSPQPQWEKHTKKASHTGLIRDFDLDENLSTMTV